MKLQHVVLSAAGRWHACYMLPGMDLACSVIDCLTERQARREALQLDAAQVDAGVPLAPEERRIVPGFYNEQMDLL